MSFEFEASTQGSPLKIPDIIARVKDASDILEIGQKANKLKTGEFFCDILRPDDCKLSSIFMTVRKDSFGIFLELNEVQISDINGIRLSFFNKLNVINPEVSGTGTYYLDFTQTIFDENMEVLDPLMLAASVYRSSNLSMDNMAKIPVVAQIVNLADHIQHNPKDPIDRL